MKNSIKFIALALVFVLCVGLAACTTNGGNNETPISNEVYEGNVIYVGNTAGTTGSLATIGVPFNLGINAAFHEYNQNGGFNGKTVALKHYDDKGTATNSVPLMEKLILEDEVFAVVGNYGGYAVNVNLNTLKKHRVPMIYAAAGVDSLYNDNATSAGDRCIFPVQPLNMTEGRSLIVRAFARAVEDDTLPVDQWVMTGGLGATKVGVIANQDEASQGILNGIKLEAETLPASKKANIVYQNVSGSDFNAAAVSIVSNGCDTVILTVTGASFTAALTALSRAGFEGNVLTSYNNASPAVLNDANNNLTENGLDIMSKMTIYAQGWLDTSSTTYVYNRDTTLFKAYKLLNASYANGVPGFTEAYWVAAEAIFSYAQTVDPSIAFTMSYNSYALAGYIAGNLFCNALEELEKSGKPLTRANLVDIMESVELQVAMADKISYAGGARTGVESFSAAFFYDTADKTIMGDLATSNHAAASAPLSGLQTIDDLRKLITE